MGVIDSFTKTIPELSFSFLNNKIQSHELF
jgi:hypothetical protein